MTCGNQNKLVICLFAAPFLLRAIKETMVWILILQIYRVSPPKINFVKLGEVVLCCVGSLLWMVLGEVRSSKNGGAPKRIIFVGTLCRLLHQSNVLQQERSRAWWCLCLLSTKHNPTFEQPFHKYLSPFLFSGRGPFEMQSIKTRYIYLMHFWLKFSSDFFE